MQEWVFWRTEVSTGLCWEKNYMDPILKGKRAISTGKIRLTFPSPLMAVISIKWITNVETTEAITKYRNWQTVTEN
jgi:hypothetical protein